MGVDRQPAADPEFAAAAGFPGPILHGLYTCGMTCKAITDNVLDGDAGVLVSYGARFAGVVFPGETLRASIWKEDRRYIGNVVARGRRDAAVLTEVELVPA